MGISFVGVATPTFGNGGSAFSATSASFTPGASGSTLLIGGGVFWSINTPQSINYSTSLGPSFVSLNPPGNPTVDHSFDGWTTAYQLSSSQASQTVSMTTSANNNSGFWAHVLEYSGVSRVDGNWNDNGNATSGPGTGVGACVGIPTVVPPGSYLVAYCSDAFNAIGSSTITPVASGGVTPTTRSSAANSSFEGGFCWADWVGTGSTIIPSFTVTANEETVVFQFLLTPLGGAAVWLLGQ